MLGVEQGEERQESGRKGQESLLMGRGILSWKMEIFKLRLW